MSRYVARLTVSALLVTMLRIFISYAPEDNQDKKPAERWLNRLTLHLRPYRDLEVFSAAQVIPGQDNAAQIREAIERASVAVLLVSPAFLASDAIVSLDLRLLFLRARRNEVRLIPVILRHCAYREARFKYPDPQKGPEEYSLAEFQPFNSPEQPLGRMAEHERDRTLASLAVHLTSLADRSGAAPPSPLVVPPRAPIAGRIIIAAIVLLGIALLFGKWHGPRVERLELGVSPVPAKPAPPAPVLPPAVKLAPPPTAVQIAPSGPRPPSQGAPHSPVHFDATVNQPFRVALEPYLRTRLAPGCSVAVTMSLSPENWRIYGQCQCQRQPGKLVLITIFSPEPSPTDIAGIPALGIAFRCP